MNDDEIIYFYIKNIEKFGLKYINHHVRIVKKRIDLLCSKDGKKVIVEIKSKNITLKDIFQILSYKKEYVLKFNEPPNLLIIGSSWNRAVEVDAKENGIELKHHLKEIPEQDVIVSINMRPKFLKKLDKKRGMVSRSLWVRTVVEKELEILKNTNI